MACEVVNVRAVVPDVFVGRPSKYGNPFPLRGEDSRAEVIGKYRVWLWAQIEAGEITVVELRALDGKSLGCFCAPRACHADVLAAAVAWAVARC